MIVNFEIEDNSAVIFENQHIDLHNNFQLSQSNEVGTSFKLVFQKNKGNWIDIKEFNEVIFTFKNVTNFYYEKGNNSEFPEDENILSTITFFPSSITKSNTSCTFQKVPQANDDVIFVFENEKIYRITCQEIKMSSN